ncbi:hypothetical protein I2486_09535 [Cellulophaga sp. E16_2]|uniref:Fibronectin type-III domain-containing protein n=1 Tax=Cellulophaga algicola (strain DSM 14237 / IC166 / ACAM 630) TaxID=688270 RepID=E6XEX9_CELAD|nr:MULTISPECIES: hypothetical protein [Cellulophaga]ADV49201.1 hypothetical protein Celal_1901 [Cellulophaga algicola DSM 14237]MBO0591649.1 hypothetical protein [Cellulophaga sp. E16_2]
MRRIIGLGVFLFIFGCSKDEVKVPSSALLVFPLQDSECTTGVDINETTRLITFEWEASNNTQSYKLTVENLLTASPQVVSTNQTSAQVQVTKGTPYSWHVVSESSTVASSATSKTWNFYNAGTILSHIPFPARLTSPLSGETVLRDVNNEVALAWSGSDLDSDIETYEVYFSTSNPPTELVGTVGNNVSELEVSVLENTVYYWRVKTIDSASNTSITGIYSFKIL